MAVGKDRESWQELQCYLFAEMLICIKEKRVHDRHHQYDDQASKPKTTRCTLKGSILIKKHLKSIDGPAGEQYMCRRLDKRGANLVDDHVLTLNLTVSELPCFFLRFQNRSQLETWRRALLDLHNPVDISPRPIDYDLDNSGAEEDDWRASQIRRQASINSSYGAGRSVATAITDYTNTGMENSLTASSDRKSVV